MKTWNPNIKIQAIIFILSFILIGLFLGYHEILFFRPRGVHFFRQTDCLSFVANYYYDGMKFFEPKLFNLHNIEGRAASEFPIVYYFVAILYFVFGDKEFLLRLVNIIIVATGFYFLFKLINKILEDFIIALFLTFLFFSSTVLLYYTNNYLPDSAALGFTLIGWGYFFSYYKLRFNKFLIFSFLFFTLSGLLKVSYLINPLTIILLFIIEKVNILRINSNKVFKKDLLFILTALISLGLVLLWTLYTRRYNALNYSYFLTWSVPIWNLSAEEISMIWDYIMKDWFRSYYYQSTFLAFFILIISSLIFVKKSDRFLSLTSLILFLGGLSYILLFYPQFKNHDYYFIALIPVIAFLVVNALNTFKKKFPRLIQSMIFKTALLIILLYSIDYGKLTLNERYIYDDMVSKIGTKLSGMRNYIDSKKIPKSAKFLVISDYTPNGSLYFINRKGWTRPDTSESSTYNLDHYINSGADYLMITDSSYINNERLRNLLVNKVGENNGVSIYKIDE